MATPPTLRPVDDLAAWAAAHAAAVQAPVGQPNEAGERMTEIAAFLGQCVDYQDTTVMNAMVRDAASSTNASLKARCDARRASTIPCGGDGAKTKCADCPKRQGISVYVRNLP